MSRKDILKIVKVMCEDIANKLEYELVDVEYVKEMGSFYLRVYIHKEGGVTLDDCQNMSEELGKVLDEKDPISEAYYLEVSSPGLDRPLKSDKDLSRNLGKEIEIKLYKAFNNKKVYEGKLESFDDKNINIVDESDNLLSIPKEDISVIKIALKF